MYEERGRCILYIVNENGKLIISATNYFDESIAGLIQISLFIVVHVETITIE